MSAGPLMFNQAGIGIVRIPENEVTEDDRQEVNQYFAALVRYLDRENDGEPVLMFRGIQVAGREYATDLDALKRQWARGQDEWCRELGCCQPPSKSRETEQKKR